MIHDVDFALLDLHPELAAIRACVATLRTTAQALEPTVGGPPDVSIPGLALVALIEELTLALSSYHDARILDELPAPLPY